ncbi:hypothetical protein [Pantoea sp. App145]|uniref:hypothetical protein n=1 Tax=Pantoea sp. App145 TaxID=3071567 RepID=UPI003A806FAD
MDSRNHGTESPEVAGTELTPEQFQDLYLYIADNGVFVGISGVSWRDHVALKAIDEPTTAPEGLSIYLSAGWPVAVYEFDVGYRVMPAFRHRWGWRRPDEQ